MTFKKLLREAAKVDTSTFKLGPKVKIQPRPQEKPRGGISAVKRKISPNMVISPAKAIPTRPTHVRAEKSLSSSKPGTLKSAIAKPLVKTSSLPAKASCATGLTTPPKDDKSHLKEISSRNSVPRRPSSQPRPLLHTKPPRRALTSSKRKRSSPSSGSDSFVVSESEPEHDYRSEIQAIFRRPGRSRVLSEDGDSDMEVTAAEVAREEALAEKLARREDEEEGKREEERVREKKKRKLLGLRKVG
jgi:SPT2 chromatin protein